MLPFILVVVAVWASAGVVASFRAARASGTPSAGPGPHPARDSFGQVRRDAYRRWRDGIRRQMPGRTRGGHRAGDLIADIGAATLAAAAIFATGFGSGAAWAAAHRGARAVRHAPPEPLNPGSPAAATRPGGHGRRHVFDGELLDPEPRQLEPGDVIDVDVVEEAPWPTGSAEPGDVTDAEIVARPTTPAPPHTIGDTPAKGPAMTEILNIHQLFDWARSVAEGTVQLVEHALLRRNAAAARAERAADIAQTAAAQAAQLEQTQARFAALHMDAASLASIAAAIQAAATLAACEQRHAEAEQMTAHTAAATAGAAEAYQVAVTVMHATVAAHQAPHAAAQAETGNAAAHSSVLAVS